MVGHDSLMEMVRGLLAPIAGIVLIFYLCGLGLALRFLPRVLSRSFLLTAPALGVAAIAVLLLPLSYAGCPPGKAAWPLVLGLVATNFWQLILLFRKSLRRGAALLIVGLKRDGVQVLIGFLGIVLVSSAFMKGTGASYPLAPWGSSDFADYWIVGDYLQKNAEGSDAYFSQTEFRSEGLRAHVAGPFARSGSMSLLAFSAKILTSGESYKVLNPLIIAFQFLLLLLLLLFCRLQEWRSPWLLPFFLLHSWMMFPLFFTYYNQASAFPVAFQGVLAFGVGLRCNRLHRLRWIGASILLGAAIVEYPAILVAASCSCLLILGLDQTGRPVGLSGLWARRRPALASALVVAMASAYYWPRILAEVQFQSSQDPLVGWEWKRLIAGPEILGWAPILSSSISASYFPFLVLLLLNLLMIACFVRGILACVRRALAIGLLGGMFALLLPTLVKLMQGVGNASHAYTKVWSMYGMVFFVICLGGAIAFGASAVTARGRVLKSLIFAFALWMEAESLGKSNQATVYSPSFIDFVRSSVTGNRKVMLRDYLEWGSFDAVLMKREDLLIQKSSDVFDHLGRPRKIDFIWVEPKSKSDRFWRQKGDFRVGLPPDNIDFSLQKGTAWMLPNTSIWEGGRVLTEGATGFFLGSPKATLELVLGMVSRSGEPAVPAKVSILVNGELVHEGDLGKVRERFKIDVPARFYRKGDDYALIEVKGAFDSTQARRAVYSAKFTQGR